jgi:histidyl-tRNA synthetase
VDEPALRSHRAARPLCGQNINDIQPKPYRSYRAGYVFRNEKPGPGRFRQFMQFDADTVGAPGVQADAEMCMMMADTMEALGIAARPVCDPGEQPQGAGWRDGSHRRDR